MIKKNEEEIYIDNIRKNINKITKAKVEILSDPSKQLEVDWRLCVAWSQDKIR